jgi:hypothetical protein
MNIRDFSQRAGDIWQNLSPGRRRVAIFAAIILFVSLVFNFASPDRQPRETKPQKPDFVFSQPDYAAEVMAEKLQTNIQSQKAQILAMQQRLENIEQAGRREAGIRSGGKLRPEVPAPTKTPCSVK